MSGSPLILNLVHVATVDTLTKHHLIFLILHLYLCLIVAELLKEF